jgi:hypothetical protein
MSGRLDTFPVGRISTRPDAFDPTGWYDRAPVPKGHLPYKRLGWCILQIDEPPGGKQSCVLTSQLNAWVVREALTTEEAEAVQEVAVNHPEYARYWRDGRSVGKFDQLVWTDRAAITALAVSQVTGKRMGFDIVPSAKLPAALSDGYAAVLTDGTHARLAYQCDETEIAVFDAKYTDMIGSYPIDEALRLQSSGRRIAIM